MFICIIQINFKKSYWIQSEYLKINILFTDYLLFIYIYYFTIVTVASKSAKLQQTTKWPWWRESFKSHLLRLFLVVYYTVYLLLFWKTGPKSISWWKNENQHQSYTRKEVTKTRKVTAKRLWHSKVWQHCKTHDNIEEYYF